MCSMELDFRSLVADFCGLLFGVPRDLGNARVR